VKLMSEVIVKYKNAEYSVYLKKLTRRERLRLQRYQVKESGEREVNVGEIELDATLMSIAQVIGKSQGIDLLKSVDKEAFLNEISDEDYEKIVEENEKLNFSKTPRTTSTEDK
jgi:hypothetical protein